MSPLETKSWRLFAHGHLEAMATGNPDYPQALWTETNLTTWVKSDTGDSVFRQAAASYQKTFGKNLGDVFKNYADRLVIHPCFHGLSDANLQQCSDIDTEYGLTFHDLVQAYGELNDLGVQLYPTFLCEASDPDHVADLFSALYDFDDHRCPLRVALISVDNYEPVQKRAKQRVDNLPLYARHASLKRWRDLIRSHYGVDYAQVPRPFTASVAAAPTCSGGNFPKYKPMLVLLKSVFRPEYRQEILTAIAAPRGTRILSSYDTNHVEQALLDRLKLGGTDFLRNCSDALLVYAQRDAKSDRIRHLPLRFCRVSAITVTEAVVNIEFTLGDYAVTKGGVGGVDGFTARMLDYFGSGMLRGGASKWVLLGEQALAGGWDAGESLVPVRMELHTDTHVGERDGWQPLIDMMRSDVFPELRQRGIFLQLLPDQAAGSPDAKGIITLSQGDRCQYWLRYYIPDFDYYEPANDPAGADRHRDERTLEISTSTGALVVSGYQPTPLAKYGACSFTLDCMGLDRDTVAEVVLQTKTQSAYAPRMKLEFRLKKVVASNG